MEEEVQALVIDNGSGMCKAGKCIDVDSNNQTNNNKNAICLLSLKKKSKKSIFSSLSFVLRSLSM